MTPRLVRSLLDIPAPSFWSEDLSFVDPHLSLSLAKMYRRSFLSCFISLALLLTQFHSVQAEQSLSSSHIRKRQTVYDTNIVEIDAEAENHSREFYKFFTVREARWEFNRMHKELTWSLLPRDLILMRQDGMSRYTTTLHSHPDTGLWDRTRVLRKGSAEVAGSGLTYTTTTAS